MIPLIEEIELALSHYYDTKKCIMLPRVHLFLNHEVDFLAVRKTGYAIEVEIKRSVADTKNDLSKNHNHESIYLAELYFAFPTSILEKCLPYIPDRAGVFEIRKMNNGVWKAFIVRKAKRNTEAIKWNSEDIYHALRAAMFKVWSLKKRIKKLKKKKP